MLVRITCLVALLFCIASSGCIRSDAVAVQTRFANEYRCGSDGVTVRRLGAGAFEATGCGQRATYVCTTQAHRGGWLCVREGGSSSW